MHDINLTINDHEIVVLTGPNGAGKSTLARAIINLLPKSLKAKGEILLNGQNILTMTPQQLSELRGKDIGFIFQESYFNPTKTIGFQYDEVLLLHAQKAEKKQAFMHRYPSQLSGGQLQNIMVEMALVLNPKLIIADEPTTAFDRNVFKAFIKRMKEYQKSILLITHSEELIEALADRVIYMESGRIVEVLKKTALSESEEIKVRNKHVDNLSILTVNNLKKSIKNWFKPKLFLLNDISFELHKNETLGIIGENGSGKSTLAKALVRLIDVEDGVVYFKKKDVTTISKSAFQNYRKNIQLVFQDAKSAFNPLMTMQQSLSEIEGIYNVKCDFLLDLFKISDETLQKYPKQISSGECQKIAIIRALMLDPEILILDEPTASLDIDSKKLLVDILQKTNKSVILISHEWHIIKDLSDRILVLKDGAVHQQGTYDYLKAHGSDYTQNLL